MIITSLDQLREFASSTLVTYTNSLDTQACVVALYGDLGAGKTAYVQALGSCLGIHDSILSPTFVLMQTYSIPSHSRFKRLVHIDAYRLEEADSLELFDFPSLFSDPENLVCIEWPSHIESVLPGSIQKLAFTFIDETTREVEVG